MKIILSILLFMALRSVAQATEFSFSEKDIYDATFDVCSKISEEKLRAHDLDFDKYYAGRFPSNKFMNMLQSIKSDSFKKASTNYHYKEASDSMVLILNNEGFKNALHDCYGDNQYPINFFEKSVLKSDRQGKIFAGAKELVTFYIGGKVFIKLYQWSKIGAATLSVGLFTSYIKEVYASILASNLIKEKAAQDCIEKGYHTLNEKCVVDKVTIILNEKNNDQTMKEINESEKEVKDKLVFEMNQLASKLEKTRDSKKRQHLKEAIAGYQELINSYK